MTSQSQTDDALLSEFARTGSQGAFRVLTDRYAGLVFSAAFRRTGQHGLAEEVAQNVFAVLARKAGALAGPGVKLAAWLHRAAVLEAARALRKESIRRRIMDDYFHQADVLSGQDAATWQAVLPELDSALDGLPARDRELLLARFFDDRSYQELAAETGRSVAALMQQQHRALARLSERLQRRGVAVPAAALGAGLGGTLVQAAPAGLSASLAATAPAAAASLGGLPLFLHTLDILMQTKTRLTLAAALAACFLGGSGAFWAGKSRAEARGEGLLTEARAAAAAASASAPPVAPVVGAATPAIPADIRAKLEQAVAGWRSAGEHRLRMQALEVVDALAPDEVPVALEVLATVKDEYGLHLELGKRIAILWGAREPEPALKWLAGELPREHRGSPMQAILTGWAKHDPQAALGWWQGVVDSLEYPIPENQFERFEDVIYSGWAAHDPGALAAQLPEIGDAAEFERLEGTGVHKQLMGLAGAAIDPATRDATLAAIAAIPTDGTRAAAAGLTSMMMNVSDAEAGRAFLLSLKFEDPSIRADLLGQAAMAGVMMQQQTPVEAVAWLRAHTDEATARRAIEDFVTEQGEEEIGDLASELRAALEQR
jgi:RNA polymerase sigma factor (sigma-70 family)